MENARVLNENVKKLMRDVEIIKNILVSEGELSDWAKENLEKAREENKSDYVDLDDL